MKTIMKTKALKQITYLLVTICAISLMNCDGRNEVGNDALLVGDWQLVAMEVTYPGQDPIKYDPGADSIVYSFLENGVVIQGEERSRYTVTRQADKTLLLTIEGIFEESEPSNIPSASPITIVLLNKKEMEWTYRVAGGVVGISNWHTYLQRIN